MSKVLHIIDHYFLLDKSVKLRCANRQIAYKLKHTLEAKCRDLIEENIYDSPLDKSGAVQSDCLGNGIYKFYWGQPKNQSWEIITDDPIEILPDLGSIETAQED